MSRKRGKECRDAKVVPLTDFQIEDLRAGRVHVPGSTRGELRKDLPFEFDEGYAIPDRVWLATIDAMRDRAERVENRLKHILGGGKP